MFEDSGAGRGSRARWAHTLSLAVCLGAGSGSLSAQERFPAGSALSPDLEVVLRPAPADVSPRPGDRLGQVLAGFQARLDALSRLAAKARARQDELTALREQNRQLLGRIAALEAERSRVPDALKLAEELTEASDQASAKVRNLVEELIAQRQDTAELSADLARAKTERAEVEKTARGKEAAWSAWTSSLRDELAQSEAQLADAAAERARLEEQARIAKAERARAARQLAAMPDQLRERDRALEQMASARSEAEDLQLRLDAAHAELERKSADNDRLAAELTAARRVADSATVMAQENLAAIEDQITMLHAAGGNALPDRVEQLDELLATAFPDGLPAMPYPKPRLSAGEVDAWPPAAGGADDPAPGADDLEFTRASFPEQTTISQPEPTTARAAVPAADSPEIVELMSTAALAADPFLSDPVARGESGAVERALGALDWGDQSGLNDATARLADGLRTTRKEAMFRRQEQVFTVDVEERAFAANSAEESVPLDPALNIQLFTAESERVGESKGGIRFFPDGSSTGGRIDLELLGDRGAVKVWWSNGRVTVER